jgi:hypothetical protein
MAPIVVSGDGHPEPVDPVSALAAGFVILAARFVQRLHDDLFPVSP